VTIAVLRNMGGPFGFWMPKTFRLVRCVAVAQAVA
jgi:hypothetical protein